MPWARLVEIRIDSAFDKGIVPHGLFEIGRRHRHALVLHDDLLGEIGEPVGAEEEAGSDVDVWRLRLPALARDRVVVEDRPDRPAAVVAVVDAGQRRVQPVVWRVSAALRVAPITLYVVLDRVVVVGDVLAASLVVEATAE